MKNGGWLENYNDSQASAPEGMVGDGFSNVGRNYSPAWGGQFEDGGLIPIAQDGRATRADSLGLYNQSKKVENFYNNKGYRKSVTDPAIINFLKNRKVKELNDIAAKKYDGKATPVDADTATLLAGITKNQYRKTIDKNKYLQRELQTNTINASAPMQLFDNRIEPKGVRSYYRSDGDGVDVFSYNTIANKPFDLLTPKEKIQRVKEFGTSGVPKSYLNKIKSTTTKETSKPTIEKREPVQSLTPLQPIGIQNDFNIEASLPVIRPDAKIPKSYDVSALRYNMKGPSDYNYNQEGVDYETAMRAKAASDAYNAEIEKRYGPESWYYTRKSPRLEAIAAERYKQLRSEFNMTPNYQMGGNVYPVNYVPQAQEGQTMFKKPSILQQEYIDPIYSYPEREPYPSELEFLKDRTDVGGMATEDNYVIINPHSPLSDEQKRHVAKLEQARLAMRNGYERPTFPITPKQQEYFNTMNKGKPYSDDLQDIKETIASRIIVGDETAQDITPEQEEYAYKLLDVLDKSKDYADGMKAMMKSKIGMAKAFEQDPKFDSSEESEYFSKNYKDLNSFQTGGSIPGSVGFTYARTKGIPSNGPYAKKTKASAQDGVDMYDNPIIARRVDNPNINRSYYDPRLNTMNIGSDYNMWHDPETGELLTGVDLAYHQDKLLAHENYHAKQHKEGRDNFDIAHNTDNEQWARMQKRPQMMTTPEVWNNFYNRKGIESDMMINKITERLPESQFFRNAAANIIYNKIVDPIQYKVPYSFEGEAKFYEDTGEEFQNGGEMRYYQNGLDWKPKRMKNGGWLDAYKEGGIIKDDRGQWEHPGEVTEISGDTMATHGYGDIPLYVVPDKGKPRIVQPNTGTQKFPGAKKFTEYPMAKNGRRQEQKGLVNLDNLLNFTNYNKPQPGGWLSKYE
jgi:hypothetical protein